MHWSAKPSRQCAEASKKGNSTLSMIRRKIFTRDKDTILRLYRTLVCICRPTPALGILHPGMESAPEIGYGKTGESSKSHKHDSGLQGFELRVKVDKILANNTGEEEVQRRLNRSLYDYYWKGVNTVGEVL